MLKKNSEQIDVFDHILFEQLIPKDHLLVKIDGIVDFSFVYEGVKDRYSTLGRGSKDPVMMFKILLLEYLYNLSDVQVANRIKTDIAFRWFLRLSVYDDVPDDTTISYFRVKRLGEEYFEKFFNSIVKQCINRGLINKNKNRNLIDTTDVAANVNYPSVKKLVRKSFNNLIGEIEKFNKQLAKEQLEKFENDIKLEHESTKKVSTKKYLEIADKHLNYLYLKTYDKLGENESYNEAFSLCYDIVDQYINNKPDKIISVVDPDARVAHKSPGNVKTGYKNHILVDEDSEIILASIQTPFNINDEKKLTELIEKVDNDLNIKPVEISADKAYGTVENRAYLKDNEIISNIPFYKETEKDNKYFGVKDFVISDDVSFIICPNGINTTEYTITSNKEGKEFKNFKIDRNHCDSCSLRDQCLPKNKNGKFTSKSKYFKIQSRYDAIIHDMKRVETEEFQEANRKRWKVERRFATMVLNHGLRRCRSVGLDRAKIHITLANMACNIIRMVKLLCHPGGVAPQN